jgi:nucleotide-binding universal stress UspA family protein
MTAFSNILFSPLSNRGNPAALRRLSALAADDSAQVTVFGTVPEASALARLLHGDTHERRIQNAARSDMVKRLQKWTLPTDENPNGLAAAVELGDPAVRIVQRVLRDGHDLVVVTTDEDQTDQVTIRRLLRTCPCPVWVIRPSRARTVRVLAAVNPDPAELELNRSILGAASSLNRLYGGELHACHAWELYGEETLRHSAFIGAPAAEIDEMVARERATHHEALAQLLASVPEPSTPWDVHIEKGSPNRAIASMVDRLRINVLVLGTIGRSGLTGLLMGNTAESLIDAVRCSVIAVKPPEFVCPVRPAR